MKTLVISQHDREALGNSFHITTSYIWNSLPSNSHHLKLNSLNSFSPLKPLHLFINSALNSEKLFNYQKTINTHRLPYVYSSLIHNLPTLIFIIYHTSSFSAACKLLLFFSNSYFISLLFIILITIVIYHQREQPNYTTYLLYISIS